MSVIFEALRKVSRSQGSDTDMGLEGGLPANAYTIRQLIFSPQGLLGISLLILVVAGLVYYGASYLGAIVKENKVHRASAQNPGTVVQASTQNNAVGDQPKVISEDVPPQPSEISYKRAEPGKLYLPSKNHNQATSTKHSSEFVYLAPRLKNTDTPTGTSPMESSPTGEIVKAHEAEGKSGGNHAVSLKHPEEKPAHAESAPGAHMKKSSHSTAKDEQFAAVSRRSIRALASSAVKPEAKTPGSVEVVDNKEREAKESWEKTATISRLVSKLQGAIMQNDEARVADLFPQLEKLKGTDDLFLLKLKGYWYMKKGDHKRATTLFERVLSKRANDLEAGLNMAIIEMKAGKVGKARYRLEALEKLYPTDTRISEILRKING